MSDNSSANCFVHLRLHTEYSISDSIVTIKPLLKRVVEQGMPAIAVTKSLVLWAASVSWPPMIHTPACVTIFKSGDLVAT